MQARSRIQRMKGGKKTKKKKINLSHIQLIVKGNQLQEKNTSLGLVGGKRGRTKPECVRTHMGEIIRLVT